VKVVVVGAGDIGRQVAEQLVHESGCAVVVVDVDAELCKTLAGELDALVLHGDGCDPGTLAKAQIAEADALVAATGSDALNTVIAMLGRRAGVEKVVVMLGGVGLRAACREIGVTEIVAPKLAAAGRAVQALHGRRRLDFSLLARSGLRLTEISAEPLVGKTLGEADVGRDAVVIGLLRGDDPVLPRADRKLAEGDVLLVLAEDDEAERTARERVLASGPS